MPNLNDAGAAPLRMFIPLTKVDIEKRLVYGVATAEEPDRSGEICDYESTKPYYKAWSDEIAKNSGGKSVGNLRAMHQKIAAGKITEINYDDNGRRIEICAKVVDDGEWEKVREGVYTGFSQGGRYVKRWDDPATKLTRYTAEPTEVSLVDLPCLPGATFSVVKAAGVEEAAQFKTVVAEPNTDAVMERALEIAKAAVGPEDVVPDPTDAQIDEARKALLQEELEKAKPAAPAEEAAATAQPAVDEPETNAEGGEDKNLKVPHGDADTGATAIINENAVTVKAADSDEPAQIWTCGCAEHRHLTKAEAKKCIRATKAADALKAVTAPVEAVLDELLTELGVEKAKAAEPAADAAAVADDGVAKDAATSPTPGSGNSGKAATHASMANFHAKHAAAGGQNADAHKAAAAAHAEAFMAHSTGAADADQKSDGAFDATTKCVGAAKAAEARAMFEPAIGKAGEAMRAEAMKPTLTLMATRLGKGLPTVARLAYAIEELRWISDSVARESAMEGDDSPLVAQMQENLKALCATLVAMVAEETRELTEGEEIGDEFSGDIVPPSFVMAASIPPAHRAALIKFTAGDETLAKVGRALDLVTAGELESTVAALERAVAVRADLAKAGRRNSTTDLARIQKVHDLAGELGADCGSAAGKAAHSSASELMEKLEARDTEIAGLRAKIDDTGAQLKVVLEEVRKLKASPAPARAAIFAVSKDQTEAGVTGQPIAPAMSKAEAQALLASLTEDERRQILTKIALANPKKILR